MKKILEKIKGYSPFYQYKKDVDISFASKWYSKIADIFNLRPNIEDIPGDDDKTKHHLHKTYPYLNNDRIPEKESDVKRKQYQRGRLWITQYALRQERAISKKIWLPASIMCLSMLLIGQGLAMTQGAFHEWMANRKIEAQKEYANKLPELQKKWKAEAVAWSADDCKDYLDDIADKKNPSDKELDQMKVKSSACVEKYKDTWTKQAQAMSEVQCVDFVKNIKLRNKRVFMSKYDKVIGSYCASKYDDARKIAMEKEKQYREQF